MVGFRRKRVNTSSQSHSSKKLSSNKIDFALDSGDEEVESDLVQQKKRVSSNNRDDVIESDDTLSRYEESSSDESGGETVEAKQIRLAREYLSRVEKIAEDDNDSNESASTDMDRTSAESDLKKDNVHRVSKRLSRERLERQGLLEFKVASQVKRSITETLNHLHLGTSSVVDEAKAWVDHKYAHYLRGHDLSVTSVALHMPTGDLAYSGSKDGSILMWDIERECRLLSILPQWKNTDKSQSRKDCEILSLACSDDGRYLAAGGRNAKVQIFDVRLSGKGVNETSAHISLKKIRGLVSTFEGHKGPITSLSFRTQSLQLFSGSEDRCIRHYNLAELAYVETLYGHQAGVNGLSCFTKDMPFSVGCDRTARAWKLAEDTHLIFRGGSKVSSADCVSAINDDYFLTGHDDGLLSLWCKDRKKPIASVPCAHGYRGDHSKLPRGVASCSALGGSDLAATGSSDGYVRLWSVSTESGIEYGLQPIAQIPVVGYVNALAIGPKGRFSIAAVGQEPRLGRWDRVVNAKNRFVIIRHVKEGNQT